MKKTLFLFLFLLNLLKLNSQTLRDITLEYQTGIKYLQENKYDKADSLITKYITCINPLFDINILPPINSIPLNDVFYNLSIAKLGKGDTLEFCKNMHRASVFNDENTFNLYCQFCVSKKDTVFYDRRYKKTNREKARYLLINLFDKKRGIEHGRIINKKHKKDKNIETESLNFGNIYGLYRIEDSDTIFYMLKGKHSYRFKINNFSYFDYVEKKIIYPENKEIAFKKYKTKTLSLKLNVIINSSGEIANLKVVHTNPPNIDKVYKDEAIRVTKEALKYIAQGKMFGNKVCTEINLPVEFKLK